MATCQAVITKALRLSGAITGRHEPALEELTVGLEALQDLYTGWIAAGMFGRFDDQIGSGSITLSENARIRNDSAEAITFTFPKTIDAGGENRVPRDLSVIHVSDAVVDVPTATALYDAYLGYWIVLDSLTLASEAPLSRRGDGLSAALAQALVKQGYGDRDNSADERRFKSALALGFDRERTPVTTEFF